MTFVKKMFKPWRQLFTYSVAVGLAMLVQKQDWFQPKQI